MSTAVPGRTPFWSDDFDMDLLKVLPAAEELLGELATVALYTHGSQTHGRLNHPAVWNGDQAMLAFFGTRSDGSFKPAEYWTSAPIVQCTFLEACRDAWVHDYLMLVDGKPVWNTFATYRTLFEPLMYHRRKWHELQQPAVDKLLAELGRSLTAASERLRRVLGAAA